MTREEQTAIEAKNFARALLSSIPSGLSDVSVVIGFSMALGAAIKAVNKSGPSQEAAFKIAMDMVATTLRGAGQN